MCMVCVFVYEGQLDFTGVSGAGRSDSPGQRAPVIATGTSWKAMVMAWEPCHLEGGEQWWLGVQLHHQPDWHWTLT